MLVRTITNRHHHGRLIMVLVMFATGVGDRTDLWSNMTFSILFYNYWYLYGIIYTFAGHTQEDEVHYYPHFSNWIITYRPFGYTLMPDSFIASSSSSFSSSLVLSRE
mmetsp:Transcript_17035/g.14487  ORF Transcript_17035/g.14487 Transcript_17035/m.14487 type:complete len:107 (+) Transcript_17035:264-584(+)